MKSHGPLPQAIFDAYAHLGSPIVVENIAIGLINKTYLVSTPHTRYVLQELSPIFSKAVIEDSVAIANRLVDLGLAAPSHHRTISGQLFVEIATRVFRALTYIEGTSHHSMASLEMAESAGRVLGQFHAALADLDYCYKNNRRHGGDYRFHQEILGTALHQHEGHDYFDRVDPLAQKMLTESKGLTAGLVTTPRHAHGDPKISNIIFNENQGAICLVDFDTLGLTGWSLEIADALRSWCNPHQEDSQEAHVDLHIAESALRGYGSVMRGRISNKEASEIIVHSQAITLCLAMRFLADVLNETYWGFDHKKYERRADHNWIRANAMYQLYSDFAQKKKHLTELVMDSLL